MNEGKKERSSNPLFAIFLIFLGIILILNNFSVLSWKIWEVVWQFWPLFLILWGVRLILGESRIAKIIVIIIGIVILFFVFIFSSSVVNKELYELIKNRIPQWSFIDNINFQFRTDLSDKRLEKLEEIFDPKQDF